MKENSLQLMPHSHITATLEALDHEGITQIEFKKIRTSSDILDKIVLVLNEKPIPLEEHIFHGNYINSIPKWNFFGYAWYYNHFGIKWWERFFVPPIKEEWIKILESSCFYSGNKIKESHIFFLKPMVPYTLVSDLHKLIYSQWDSKTIREIMDVWYQEAYQLQWCLVTATALPLSRNFPYEKQLDFVPREYKVPSLSTGLISLLFQHWSWKCETGFVRTQTLDKKMSDEENKRFIIGKERSDGRVCLQTIDDDCSRNDVGIAAQRLLL